MINTNIICMLQWNKRLLAASDTFQYKQYRGEVPQADAAEQEGLVVDGESYEVVDSFC